MIEEVHMAFLRNSRQCSEEAIMAGKEYFR